MKCTEKFRFKSWKEAQVFAKSYNQRIPLTFGIVQAYWCDKHESWHIGHSNKRRNYQDGARIFSDGAGTNLLRTHDADVSETIGTVESESYDFN